MSAETEIFAALKGLVANRVFPDVAPPNTPRPYITYQPVGGEPINYLEQEAPNKENGRWQINVWADTRLEASALARQAANALRLAPALQTRVLASPVALYEPDTKLRGTRQDFSCWVDV